MNSTLFLTPRQLHERWNFHPESIRRIIREGRLPAIRIGKRLRIALADVEAFEAASRIGR
jgi:excisionase family DNA binding protein